MLAERLLAVPGIMLLQVNTDGLTCRVPRWAEGQYDAICKQWESETRLDLEYARYKRMAIRDVNSYIGVRTDGKIKLIGAYVGYSSLLIKEKGKNARQWHQDSSALVIALAAEAALVQGTDIRSFIESHTDPFDFMLRAKAPGGSYLTLNTYEGGAAVQKWRNVVTGDIRVGIPTAKDDATHLMNTEKYDRDNWERVNNIVTENQTAKTVRYFIAHQGEDLVKVSPPPGGCVVGHYKRGTGVTQAAYNQWDNTVWNSDIHTKNQSRYETRRTSFEAGWNVALCNHVRDFDWANLNREYYIQLAEKLVKPLLTYP
jgi:hypothetical protein